MHNLKTILNEAKNSPYKVVVAAMKRRSVEVVGYEFLLNVNDTSTAIKDLQSRHPNTAIYIETIAQPG